MVCKGKKILGIVPARMDSKGLFQKNIKLFRGKPLLHYALHAALGSKHIDKVILSTESEKIISICNQIDKLETVLRPSKLASDTASSISVVQHVIEFEKDRGFQYDVVIIIQPTSPLVIADDIDQTLALHINRKVNSCFTVSKVQHFVPSKFFMMDDSNIISPLFDGNPKNRTRQNFASAYSLNGSCFSFLVEDVMNGKAWEGKSVGYEIPSERSIDIDTELDFEIAQFLHRKFFGQK